MYAFFSDAHFHKPGWEVGLIPLQHAVEREREAGSRVVWLGDTLDLWHASDAALPGLVRPEDLWVPGNHDWGYIPSGLEVRRYLDLGSVWVGHGDEVDFHYLFALLERREWGGLLARLHPWKRGHVERLYQLLEAAPDWVIRQFEGSRLGNRRMAALVALLLLPALLLGDARPYPPSPELPPPTMGIVSREPADLQARYWALVPESVGKHLVIGHLHSPGLALVGGRAVMILGCWGDEPERWAYGRLAQGNLELVRWDGAVLAQHSAAEPNSM